MTDGTMDDDALAVALAGLAMTIDGQAVTPTERFDVIDPATARVFAQAPECSSSQLDQAFVAAQAAFATSWSVDENDRCRRMLAAAERLREDVNTLARLTTAEQGKPLAVAAQDVEYCAVWLEYFATLQRDREIVRDDASATIELVHRPLGVVAAIVPWNVPLTLAMWKIAPALRAGNTIVVKPSPYTPLATLRMGEILRNVFPAGVLNVVTGRDPLGATMTSHPIPRKVSFTGSVGTGKKVAAAAGADLKRVTLELGGNDPAIILDDADLDTAVPAIFGAAFALTGQICVAIKRVYAPAELHDAVVERLVALADSATVGAGSTDGVDLGPLNNAAQLERVEELVADAVANGATVETGGSRFDRPGYFYPPTILTGASDDTGVVAEEQFGPVLPVLSYRTIDEAVERANATSFGLGASVWGADLDRAESIARRLEAGNTWVNTHMALEPSLPLGGLKSSGVGLENGPWGLEEFTEAQLVYVKRASARTAA